MGTDNRSCTPETLDNKAGQAGELAAICELHGEADGANALRSIQRALIAEAAKRRG